VPVVAQEMSDTNMEILKQKLKADKKLLVAGNMDLSDAEAKKFWPIYDAYQKDLEQLNQKLGHTIKDYADAFNKGPIQDNTAKKLLNEALSAEEQETKLKRTYAEKLEMELAQQIPLAY
jgi:hypothetical protein